MLAQGADEIRRQRALMDIAAHLAHPALPALGGLGLGLGLDVVLVVGVGGAGVSGEHVPVQHVR